MSISSRAVALIVAKPLDPEKARRYTHMRFESRWTPRFPKLFARVDSFDGYFWPEPRSIDAYLDKHMKVFWTVAAVCSIYAAWIVFGLLV